MAHIPDSFVLPTPTRSKRKLSLNGKLNRKERICNRNVSLMNSMSKGYATLRIIYFQKKNISISKYLRKINAPKGNISPE